MDVRIFQPSKSAMQSGRAQSKLWLIEPAETEKSGPEPLMGWNSAQGTKGQIKMEFPSLEAALHFAEKKGWKAQIDPAHRRTIKPRNYADNFRYVPTDEE